MLNCSQLLVIKFGSSSLVSEANDDLQQNIFIEIAHQIRRLRDSGTQVIVVSSGAVALGRHVLPDLRAKRDIPSKQILATVGQHRLMTLWDTALTTVGMMAGQVLVTKAELLGRAAHLNVRETVSGMLRYGIVPIVNENDSVAVDEIRYGDNDTLSAYVALVAGAEGIILWTDVPGVFTANPNLFPTATFIPEIRSDMLDDYRDRVGGSVSRIGTGGMTTKLECAGIAASGGIWTRIAGGRSVEHLAEVVSGGVSSTLILPSIKQVVGKKRRILAATVVGSILCDEGASLYVTQSGASLLAVGVVGIKGEFSRGDSVHVISGNRLLGVGLVRYPSDELTVIMGLQASEIEASIGYTNGPEVVHRDDFVLS